MKNKIKKTVDPSAEEKIKEAARKLFTQKGFASVRTRDIATEAGINLALLNYYFRSKEKLFEIIMKENIKQFINVITGYFKDDKLSIEEKMEILVSNYIDMLIQNPDLPFFILYEMRSGRSAGESIDSEFGAAKNVFFNEIQNAMKLGKITKIHPLHVISNMIGLTVFPFIAAPMLTERMGKMGKNQFNELMIERKKLIPMWMKLMMKAK